MANNYKHPQFNIRIPREYIEKLKVIADENARSTTKEIELLVKKRIEEYESENGIIIVEKEDNNTLTKL